VGWFSPRLAFIGPGARRIGVEGQKSECASGGARGGGRLGTLTAVREAVILVAVFILLGIMAAALIVHFVVP